ncbi:MAG: proton-conducting transporter membrane subunit [Candidatus Obscuribacterales bacterium]
MSSIFPLLAALMPLASALVSALPSADARRFRLGWLFLVAAFASSLPILWQALSTADPIHITLFASPWKFLPVVELSIDRLAAIMMVVISGIGMLLYRYSLRYLQQDPGLSRFLTLLSLCISSILLMVSSADLLTLFMTWQLLGWFLCLLSHNYAHNPTADSSFRTFIMLRVGDIAFLSGIALAYHLFGTVRFAQLFELAAADQSRFALLGTGLEISGATAITLLIFVGAMSKSAQFPLHMWLPDSLYAPTPIHALLHAGIINAGGFLLNRLAPLYALSPVTLHLVLVVGLLTMIFGKCMMLSRNDIKKTLGYSTIGQMGYMMMECGFGAFSLAVFHLIAHGLFKATVFLNCGDVIHKARLDPERPPQPSTEPGPGIVAWLAGIVLSLVLPLALIAGAHDFLGIGYLDRQAIFIFMLFSWVTASHAMLTLFRLETGWRTVALMLIGVCLISLAYFSFAEQFTHFLYPDPLLVTSYLQAAALPDMVFFCLTAMLVVSIVVSWFMLYLHYHDKIAIRSGRLWSEFYLFFINRLYLDALSLRLFDSLKRFGRAIDQSRVSYPVLALIALICTFLEAARSPAESVELGLILVVAVLLFPLFPFHGLYAIAFTRGSRAAALGMAFIPPLFGVLLISLVPLEIPSYFGTLAMFGALWGSLKALVQVRVSSLLAYAGLALYSVLWWHLAQVGRPTPDSIVFAVSVTLVIGGLCLAWDRVRVRYGDLNLNRIGGLFKPMPRFALCTAILVMAAVGLPPFGLFFGYLGIILSPGVELSAGLVVVIAAWFAASWYLFKQLMQRLLFGPHRDDIKYDDLRPAEIAAFAILIALMVIPGSIPHHWLSGGSS